MTMSYGRTRFLPCLSLRVFKYFLELGDRRNIASSGKVADLQLTRTFWSITTGNKVSIPMLQIR